MAGCVMIMAGGTGGHIFPALAVAEELRERGVEVRWMGSERGMEARLVPPAGFEMDRLSVSGLRGMGFAARVKAPFMLAVACWQAGCILHRRKPEAVLGMGGFVSGPGGLMAWLLGVPLIVHEQNRIPGTTNRLLARLARRVFEAFPDTFKTSRGAVTVGNPLRREIAAIPAREEKGKREPLRILVIGGSQGAKVLNEVLPEASAQLAGRVIVLHQCGSAMVDETRRAYQAAGVDARVEPFIEDMADVYAWADIAVCRSGAMTVSELAAAGLPSILVPFPYAIDDHQTHNARYLSDAGAAILMPQQALTASRLADSLAALEDDRQELAVMARSARELAKRDAAQRVADACMQEAGL